MYDRKTNVIKLNVKIELINEVLNNRQRVKGFQWASEVGRTLYSLCINSRFYGFHHYRHIHWPLGFVM